MRCGKPFFHLWEPQQRRTELRWGLNLQLSCVQSVKVRKNYRNHTIPLTLNFHGPSSWERIHNIVPSASSALECPFVRKKGKVSTTEKSWGKRSLSWKKCISQSPVFLLPSRFVVEIALNSGMFVLKTEERLQNRATMMTNLGENCVLSFCYACNRNETMFANFSK